MSKIYVTVYFRFSSYLWSIIHEAVDTCDSACTQSSRFTGSFRYTRLRASVRNIFIEKAMASAQGKRHSKWSKRIRWGHLDGGWFDDIITRITLAYVNVQHACTRSYEYTWIRAHSQFLTQRRTNTRTRTFLTCTLYVHAARLTPCRDRKNRRRSKRARTKDPISSLISTVKKKDSARVSR